MNYPELSRRQFVEKSFITATSFLLAGCAQPREIPLINLEDLIRKPELFFNRYIRTQAYPFYTGQESYMLPYVYTDLMDGRMKVSYSQVVKTTHRLHLEQNSESKSFTAIQQSGGMLLPMPVVPASGTIYKPDSLHEVAGTVTRTQDSKYYLDMNSARSVVPPTK